MCVTSYVGDYFRDKLPERHPWTVPIAFPNQPYMPTAPVVMGPTREEFDARRKEVSELKELLRSAQKFDAETGQPSCEHEDKVALIRKVAEIVGVSMDDVFGARPE